MGEAGWAWLRHRERGRKGPSLRGVFSTFNQWLLGRNGGPVLPEHLIKKKIVFFFFMRNLESKLKYMSFPEIDKLC